MTQDVTYTAEMFAMDRLSEHAALSALVDARIYGGKAPGETEFPCVVFRYYDGSDEYVIGGERLQTSMTFIVAVVDTDPSENVALQSQAAAYIDDALQSTSEGSVHNCLRIRPWRSDYTINGRSFVERGGIYELSVGG